MSLQVDTPYAIQSVFTLNVVAQLPGGMGPAGFSTWAGLLTGSEFEMASWKLVQHASNLFQITNGHWPSYSIGAIANGYAFITSGGFNADQVWSIEQVGDDASTYTIQNNDNGLYLYDPAGCGVEGVPRAAQPIYRYNPDRFHWKFIVAD